MKTYLIIIIAICIAIHAKEEDAISDAELNELLKDPKYASMAAELKSLEGSGKDVEFITFRSKSRC
jgi:hypothetical protein